MDGDLSLATIRILAETKVLLAVTLAVLGFVLWRRPRAWQITAIAAASVTTCYLLVSWPLQKMWHGSVGDETFMMAFVANVLLRGDLGDFYYTGLPAFYPPLFFWATGLLGKILGAQHAVSAMKVGVAAVLALWFAGGHALQAAAYRFRIARPFDAVCASPWFWCAVPLAAFFLLTPDDLMVKPYKAIAGLGVCLFLGLFAEALHTERWQARHIAFFGTIGGLLFLTYYLWWFMAIPAMVVLALALHPRRRGLLRIAAVGNVMFAVAAVYIVPLFLSYRGGMENWQAVYFVPADFFTFLPTLIDWRLPIVLAGVAALIAFRRVPFLRAQLLLIAASYVFQFLSIVLFLLGGKPLQAAQPFHWLVLPALGVGAAYGIVWCAQTLVVRWNTATRTAAAIGLVLFTLPLWPMTRWIDDPHVQQRIEADLQPSGGEWLAAKLRQAVPDWADRTWLSSGYPELNGYLPIHYFIGHSPQYSHHAARYSERFAVIERLSRAEDATFAAELGQTPIDALLLYRDPTASSIPFSFWFDNYPNGGREGELRIPADRFAALGWRTAYDDGSWYVLLKP